MERHSSWKRGVLSAATVVALAVGSTAQAHESSSLHAPDGGGARGETRLESDELRIKGDRLAPGAGLSISISADGMEFVPAFESTVESNGSFEIRVRDSLPASLAAFGDFGGLAGAWIRIAESGGTVVLEGRLAGNVDRNEDGVGTAALAPPAGGMGNGRVRVKARDGRHLLEVKVRALAPRASFVVCLSAPDGATEEVGTIATGDSGNGTLKLDTESGRSLPFGAGNAAMLVGFSVAVKDADGNVVLSGVVPALGDDGENGEDPGEIQVEFDLARAPGSPEAGIGGDVKLQSEIERDTVRVRIDDAMAHREYRAFFTRDGEAPEEVMVASLTTDEDGDAEHEERGRPIFPFGADAISELSGVGVEIYRVDGEELVLVLVGTVPDIRAVPPPGGGADPLPRLKFVTVLTQPGTPVLPLANGKVEFEEQDDEHEIEVEVEDLVPGATYSVELHSGDASASLFAGAADGFGDIRSKEVFFGGEPLPLGVASLRELAGATVTVADADGMTVLEGTVSLPDGTAGGIAATPILFTTVGSYDTAFLRGDANGDRSLDIADSIAILQTLFQNRPAPACPDAIDVNDDGGVDISDAVYGLIYLFGIGRPPPFPGDSIAGFDPTLDRLRCADD